MQNVGSLMRFLHVACIFTDSKINVHRSLSSNDKTLCERPPNLSLIWNFQKFLLLYFYSFLSPHRKISELNHHIVVYIIFYIRTLSYCSINLHNTELGWILESNTACSFSKQLTDTEVIKNFHCQPEATSPLLVVLLRGQNQFILMNFQ